MDNLCAILAKRMKQQFLQKDGRIKEEIAAIDKKSENIEKESNLCLFTFNSCFKMYCIHAFDFL